VPVPADNRMHIRFYHVDGLGRDADDGGAIFDRKTIAAFRQLGAVVDELPVLRRRALRLPTWAGRIEASRLCIAQGESGGRTILSHEATFDLAGVVNADALIVHNYFPRFRFPGRKGLELYYRLGALDHYRRAFDRTPSIFFLSYRERDAAEEDFPSIRGRTTVIPPPPAPVIPSARNMEIVHVSGSEGWLPKRLSRLTDDEIARFGKAGFVIGDFGTHPASAFGLINDRFTVGFKLKLMQMIACRDIIASCADIADEMERIAPGYPFWRQVASVDEALEYFRDIRDRLTVEEIDAAFDKAAPRWRVPSWNDHGEAILHALSAT
jgi:hypothetical protein